MTKKSFMVVVAYTSERVERHDFDTYAEAIAKFDELMGEKDVVGSVNLFRQLGDYMTVLATWCPRRI